MLTDAGLAPTGESRVLDFSRLRILFGQVFDFLQQMRTAIRQRTRAVVIGMRARVTAAQMSRVREIISPSCRFAATSDGATDRAPATTMALVRIGGPVLAKASARLREDSKPAVCPGSKDLHDVGRGERTVTVRHFGSL